MGLFFAAHRADKNSVFRTNGAVALGAVLIFLPGNFNTACGFIHLPFPHSFSLSIFIWLWICSTRGHPLSTWRRKMTKIGYPPPPPRGHFIHFGFIGMPDINDFEHALVKERDKHGWAVIQFFSVGHWKVFHFKGSIGTFWSCTRPCHRSRMSEWCEPRHPTFAALSSRPTSPRAPSPFPTWFTVFLPYKVLIKKFPVPFFKIPQWQKPWCFSFRFRPDQATNRGPAAADSSISGPMGVTGEHDAEEGPNGSCGPWCVLLFSPEGLLQITTGARIAGYYGKRLDLSHF